MHKEISIVVSDTIVTASVQERRESSTVIAASKKDDDILEAAKNAIDGVFDAIRINDEAGGPITAIRKIRYQLGGTLQNMKMERYLRLLTETQVLPLAKMPWHTGNLPSLRR